MAEGVAAEGGEAEPVTFGHGARHLPGTGLDQAEVEEAITTSVQRSAQGARAVSNFWGRVTVDGRVVEYRAAKLADGSINVGTQLCHSMTAKSGIFQRRSEVRHSQSALLWTASYRRTPGGWKRFAFSWPRP